MGMRAQTDLMDDMKFSGILAQAAQELGIDADRGGWVELSFIDVARMVNRCYQILGQRDVNRTGLSEVLDLQKVAALAHWVAFEAAETDTLIFA